MQPLSVLIVDDFEDFRRFLRLALQEKSEYQIIAEGVRRAGSRPASRRISTIALDSNRLFSTADGPVRYLRDMYVHSEDLPLHFIGYIAHDILVRAPRPTREGG